MSDNHLPDTGDQVLAESIRDDLRIVITASWTTGK